MTSQKFNTGPRIFDTITSDQLLHGYSISRRKVTPVYSKDSLSGTTLHSQDISPEIHAAWLDTTYARSFLPLSSEDWSKVRAPSPPGAVPARLQVRRRPVSDVVGKILNPSQRHRPCSAGQPRRGICEDNGGGLVESLGPASFRRRRPNTATVAVRPAAGMAPGESCGPARPRHSVPRRFKKLVKELYDRFITAADISSHSVSP
eukprot:RCo019437